jgi:site-specific recombinase XerD
MEIVRRILRERRYSARTERAYVQWIRRYIVANDRRHPSDLGASDVARFLSSLALEAGVAASTQNQALAALTFLYSRVLRQPLERVDGVVPARRPRRLPVVLSLSELRAIVRYLSPPYDLCVALMYGSGLRVTECVRLRVKDVDLERREIVVRSGKGDKDRRVPLAGRCVQPLRALLEREEGGSRAIGARGSGPRASAMRCAGSIPPRSWTGAGSTSSRLGELSRPPTDAVCGIICTRASCSARSTSR